jgi:hypothetical protein
MRNILLAIILAMLPASAALSDSRKPDKPATGKLLPVKPAGSGNACAAYGAGFVKVESTDTCVKVGGAVSIGAGTSAGGR